MDTPGMWQQVGFLADIFACFKAHGLSIDLVSTSEMNITVSLDPASNDLSPENIARIRGDLERTCLRYRTRGGGGAARSVGVGQEVRV